MKLVFCCLTLSALSAFSATVGGAGAPLRIYTEFRSVPTQAIQSTLESELSALVAPIGLAVEWRSLANPRYGEASAALVVATFTGTCEPVRLQPRRAMAGPLAWTHISDGVILPFVDVDCDHLRDLLQAKLLQVDARKREQLFGRAVARVLGHELYHVFAETRHHGKGGVAQPAFTAGELLSSDFNFGEHEFRILSTSKLRELLRFRKPYGDKPRSGQEAYTANGCGACHGDVGQGTRLAPALRGKSLDPKTLTARFEKKREDMYRRARNMKLQWQFPTDEEIADILTALESGLD
jgi:cytochrome c553